MTFIVEFKIDLAKDAAKKAAQRAACRASADRTIREAIGAGDHLAMTAALLDAAFHAFSEAHGEVRAATRLASMVGRQNRPESPRKAADKLFGGVR